MGSRVQPRAQSNSEVSDHCGFTSEDGQFRERSALERNEVKRKISGVSESWPCSRLLPGPGRHAEHRAHIAGLGRGEASRPGRTTVFAGLDSPEGFRG
jgi:hypothetical protein